MIAFADLFQPVTSAQIKRSIYNALGATGASTTVWKPGGVVRTIIAAVAIVLGGFSQLIYLALAGGFLTLAQGGWLTLLARYVYGVERELATFAVGDIRVTNVSASVYDFDAQELIVVNLDTGKTYRNTLAFTLLGNTVVTTSFVAIESGAASSSIAGAITGIKGAVLTGVSVVNPASLVGLDDELDPQLVTRCFDKLGALSPNGPSDAYAYFLRTAKRLDGNSISINRISVSKDGFGNVFLTAATPSGGIPGTVENPNSDLGAAYDSILKNATPLCVTPHLQSAGVVVQDYVGTIYAYSTQGLDAAGVIAAANKALGDLLARVPIGGYSIDGDNILPKQTQEGAIEQALSSVFYVKLTTPANDLHPGVTQITALGSTNFNVVFQQREAL